MPNKRLLTSTHLEPWKSNIHKKKFKSTSDVFMHRKVPQFPKIRIILKGIFVPFASQYNKIEMKTSAHRFCFLRNWISDEKLQFLVSLSLYEDETNAAKLTTLCTFSLMSCQDFLVFEHEFCTFFQMWQLRYRSEVSKTVIKVSKAHPRAYLQP